MIQIELIKQLYEGFKSKPLPTICAVLVAATVYLFFSLMESKAEVRQEEKKHHAEISALTKQHTAEITEIKDRERARTDSIQKIELEKTKQQNLELENLLKDFRKLKRK